MIRKPSNWNEVQEYTEFQKLPLGAYVCRVKRSMVQDNDYGSQLVLLYDIVEGEYSGFYNKDFQNNQNKDKKWKGVLRIWLPKDDGSESDEMTKRSFKGFVTSVEKSNPGYQFDWNETSLVGKMLGVLYRNEEYDYQGRQGWTARPFRALSVDSVREGKFKLPKEKPLKDASRTVARLVNDGYTEVSDDDDLPF